MADEAVLARRRIAMEVRPSCQRLAPLLAPFERLACGGLRRRALGRAVSSPLADRFGRTDQGSTGDNANPVRFAPGSPEVPSSEDELHSFIFETFGLDIPHVSV